MSKNFGLIVISALALSISASAQDSPSLGDLARKAQKDKADKPVAKVITNDDMPSGSAGVSLVRGGGSAKNLPPGATGETITSPAEGIQKLQSMLDQIDSMDRTALAVSVLDGNTAKFPGRAQWEAKLFTAKQAFVARGRALLQSAKQIEASAEGMKDVQDQNDPRVKNLAAKLLQLVQDNQQNSTTFQAVIAEGQELASKSASH